MKPLSMRRLPSRPRTSWVWACPPSRVSPSKSVTSWVALRTWAAVSPDTPAPMTAAVGRSAPGPAGVTVRFGRVTEASWLMWSRVVRRGAPTGLPGGRVRWGALSILRPHRRVAVQGLSKVGEGMEIERSVTVGQPVDRVFAYLSDFTNTTEWDPGTVRTERVAGDGAVGTRYHNVSKFLGRETELDYLVVEHVPREKFALRGEHSTVVATDTMTFMRSHSVECEGEGTTVTY